MSNSERVFSIVREIPKGKVLTYKKLAELSGIKSPRVVGNILHKNPDPDHAPCHRVIRSDGTLATGFAFGGKDIQAQKLVEEGIEIVGGKIDLDKYFWKK